MPIRTRLRINLENMIKNLVITHNKGFLMSLRGSFLTQQASFSRISLFFSFLRIPFIPLSSSFPSFSSSPFDFSPLLLQ